MEKKEPKEISRDTWTFERIQYDDETSSLLRTNDGFNALEMLGMASMATTDITMQLAGDIEPPTFIKRIVKN